MNLHSMSRIKFSYCFSVRMTPIGHPVHFNMPSSTNQVSLEVFTSTKLVRSFPLKSFLNCGTLLSLAEDPLVPEEFNTGTLPRSEERRVGKECNSSVLT